MQNTVCNVCSASEYTLLYEAKEKKDINSGFSLGTLHPSHGRIVKCKECGLVYVNPQPNIKELTKKYSRLIDSGYSSQQNSRIKTFRRKIKLIEKYAEKGRLLDIGCASGYFLSVAQKNGWQIDGVELSQDLVKQAEALLNIKVYPLTVEEVNFPSDYFDAVSMFDVFEHLPEPGKTLKEISRITKPNGLLVINFPAIDSVFAKVMGRHWWLLLEDHLNYFSRKVLTKLLRNHGFKVMSFKPHWQDLTFIYLAKLLQPFSPKLSKTLSFIARILHIENLSLRYYIGQVTVLAKKV